MRTQTPRAARARGSPTPPSPATSTATVRSERHVSRVQLMIQRNLTENNNITVVYWFLLFNCCQIPLFLRVSDDQPSSLRGDCWRQSMITSFLKQIFGILLSTRIKNVSYRNLKIPKLDIAKKYFKIVYWYHSTIQHGIQTFCFTNKTLPINGNVFEKTIFCFI